MAKLGRKTKLESFNLSCRAYRYRQEGLTLQEIADKTGVSIAQVGRYLKEWEQNPCLIVLADTERNLMDLQRRNDELKLHNQRLSHLLLWLASADTSTKTFHIVRAGLLANFSAAHLIEVIMEHEQNNDSIACPTP